MELAVVPGACGGDAQLGGEAAFALPDSVVPVALELLALGGDILAFTVFLVVSVVALVKRIVIPYEFA